MFVIIINIIQCKLTPKPSIYPNQELSFKVAPINIFFVILFYLLDNFQKLFKKCNFFVSKFYKKSKTSKFGS